MASLVIRMFGGWQLEVIGASGPTAKSPRLELLLAHLIINHGVPQSRAQVAYLLWPDTIEAQARVNLRQLLVRLRHYLPDLESFVEIESQTLTWRSDASFNSDLLQFVAAVQQAEAAQKTGDACEERAALEAAAALYRGDLLPEFYDDWLEEKREQLRQSFSEVLQRLCFLLEQQGEYRRGVSLAERLVRHDPLVEESHLRLMRFYFLTGERAKALHAYHNCASILEQEFSIAPGVELQAAYERLINIPASTPITPRDTAKNLSRSPFIGRSKELDRLSDLWREACMRRSKLVVLKGDAGIGKTRLVEELAARLRQEGTTVLSARCFGGSGQLAYAPVATLLQGDGARAVLSNLDDVWLTEVARLLPELLQEKPSLQPPGPLQEGWEQRRFIDGLARAVLAAQPVLIVIDDLQWCDTETLGWLSYVLHAYPQEPFMVAATLRAEEAQPTGPLAEWLGSLYREDQVEEVELVPLDEEETMNLARAVDNRLEPDTLVRLYKATEGNPLFIVEMARVGAADQPGYPTTPATTSVLPPKVQAVVAARLDRMTAAARDLLEVAAVVGRTFDFEVLLRASRQPEDAVVRGLDELWQRRIVRERGAQGYDFSHDKFREMAYSRLSQARRRMLHRIVAETLREVDARTLSEASAQIAFHYEQAESHVEAVNFYLDAAQAAGRLYANTQALVFYGRVLALTETPVDEEWRHGVRAQAYESKGDILHLERRSEKAGNAFACALKHVSSETSVVRARLNRKLGATYIPEGRYQDALAASTAAEAALGPRPEKDDRAWLQEWIAIRNKRVWTLYWLNRWVEMDQLCSEMKEVVERYANASERGNFYFSLVATELKRKRFVISEEVLGYARAELSAKQEVGRLNEISVALFHLGFCLFWYGDLNEAEQRIRDSFDLAVKTGDSVLKARALTYLAILYRKRGDPDATRRAVEEALDASKAARLPLYIAAAQANVAWLAWRANDPQKAETEARAALLGWQNAEAQFPCLWIGLLPLAATLLGQHRAEEALPYLKMLLTPSQQLLPEALTRALEETIRLSKAGCANNIDFSLSRVIEEARKHDFL